MLSRDVTVVNGMVRSRVFVGDTDYSQYSDEALQQLLDTMPPGTPKYVIDEIKKEIERRDKKTKDQKGDLNYNIKYRSGWRGSNGDYQIWYGNAKQVGEGYKTREEAEKKMKELMYLEFKDSKTKDVFSESARKAALEARRRKMKGKSGISGKGVEGQKKEGMEEVKELTGEQAERIANEFNSNINQNLDDLFEAEDSDDDEKYEKSLKNLDIQIDKVKKFYKEIKNRKDVDKDDIYLISQVRNISWDMSTSDMAAEWESVLRGIKNISAGLVKKDTKDAFSESARKAALEARRRKMKSKGEIQKNPRGEKKEKESSGLFEKLREDPEWQKVLRLREKAMSEDFKGNISAANELRKQVSEILKNHELYQKWVKEEMGNQRGEVSSKKLTDEIKKDPGKTQAYLFDKVSELLPEGDIDTMSQHDSLYVVITPNNDSPEEIKKIEQIAKQAMKGFDGKNILTSSTERPFTSLFITAKNTFTTRYLNKHRKDFTCLFIENIKPINII